MYSTVYYSTVKYSTVQYSTVQYSTVQYSTVQYRCYLYLDSPGTSQVQLHSQYYQKNDCLFITCVFYKYKYNLDRTIFYNVIFATNSNFLIPIFLQPLFSFVSKIFVLRNLFILDMSVWLKFDWLDLKLKVSCWMFFQV